VADLPEGVVEAVVIRPGDTLVIRVHPDVRSRDHFDALVEELTPALKKRMPDVELVFLAGVEQLLAYRPGTN
jgi:hypothetical protein